MDEEYNNAYWKWKDADEANKKAQIASHKYEENMYPDISDFMIELKEMKSQNEDLKNEMQQMKAILRQMMMQQNEMLSFKFHEMAEQLYEKAKLFTGNRTFTFPN